MSKETFYFKHDYNARHDRKLVNVIMKHGMIGIGVYWCVVEMLYEEGGYLPLNKQEYERISFELRVDVEIVEVVINNFGLFSISTDTKLFFSDTVLERLQERCDKSDKARASINKRWNKLGKNTNVIRPQNARNTRRREERKGKDINIIPSLEEIAAYCLERKNSVNPDIFFNFYESKDWMIGKNKMKNWKAAIHTWEKNDSNKQEKKLPGEVD
jgi:bacterioferritin (cytochrome b1)